MKKLLNFVALAALIFCGLVCYYCTFTKSDVSTTTTIDTVKIYDTIRVTVQEPRESTVIRYVTVKLPTVDTGHDTAARITNEEDNKEADSAEVIIPISQKVYEDSNYTAWISGYRPNLDSLTIRTRREIITVKEFQKPKRWNVGAFVGYGITPKGLQPCIGISVNYSIWNP